MKRIFDVIASAVGLIVSSPLIVIVAGLVKLDSSGPVIFRQERVGMHGRPFKILKFRTMHVNHGGSGIIVGDDGRITRSGSWLRSTKLDELPQLINVVRGEMSLVGPRPELPEYVAHWSAAARARVLSVRPGITDPAAIQFRRESEMLAKVDDPQRYYLEVLLPQKVALYERYVAQQSFTSDCKVIGRTIMSVIRG
jgi:lipopolysaccharide/colanic/teichoic acid biosynthesis glycosyltransferase